MGAATPRSHSAGRYDPTADRFLSVDPVPGGNANNHGNGGPLNRFDLGGKWSWRKLARGAGSWA
ncbi:hypothetical protein ACFW93_44155 [Streptomyces canus]|uniref:hypothetical protein n=1 Tax=Streptomyces canus TaxID=58343 RepID=UPI00368EA2B2